MRLVFDTNIFISALVIQGGEAEKAVYRVIDGVDDLIISRQIIREVLDVLYWKFGREEEELSRLAVYLADLSTSLVDPKKTVSVLRDESDNRILECALSGKADRIVTGDKEMLKLKEFNQILIISLREYLYQS